MAARSTVQIFIVILIFLASALVVSAANDGTILSLTATDGPNPGETITVSITIQADDRVNNSNVFFQIISPTGIVIATHTYNPPRMEDDETVSYSWTSNNSSYPDIGSYTLEACWSTGGAGNCNIAQASTTFFSADSLGPMAIIGLGMIVILVLRARKVEVASE